MTSNPLIELNMYCGQEGCGLTSQYIDNDSQGAMIQARADGWLVYCPPESTEEVHICPICSGVKDRYEEHAF